MHRILVPAAALLAAVSMASLAGCAAPATETRAVSVENTSDLPPAADVSPCPQESSDGPSGGSDMANGVWLTLVAECVDSTSPLLGDVRKLVDAADIMQPNVQGVSKGGKKYAYLTIDLKDRPAFYVNGGTITVELINVTMKSASVSQRFDFDEGFFTNRGGGAAGTFTFSRETALEIQSGDTISVKITRADLTVTTRETHRESVTIPKASLPGPVYRKVR
jgi:hypothetical protein